MPLTCKRSKPNPFHAGRCMSHRSVGATLWRAFRDSHQDDRFSLRKFLNALLGSPILDQGRSRPPVLICCVVSTLLTLSSHVRGDSVPLTLDPIVIVGTRVPTAMHEGTDSVSIVTREQIDRMGAATAIDLFRLIPGLQIDQVGGPGGLSSIYIRGSDPNHVLVLIDGIRVNDPTNSRGGSFDVSNLDPTQIERIEVLRGSASSIYGADAMGGVINIVTRKGESGVGGEVGWGGLGYRSLNVRASRSGDLAISAAASSLRDGRQSDGSTLDLRQFTAAAGLTISPDARVQLNLRHSERESASFPDDSGGILLAQIRALEQRRGRDSSLGLRGTWDLGALSLNAAATGFEHGEDIESPGVAPGVRNAFGVPASRAHTTLRRTNALLNGVMHLAHGSELAIGIELQREYGVNRTVYSLFGSSVPADFNLLRNTRAAFTELKWLLTDDWVVRLGLRRDSVEANDARTSPSIGTRYNLPALGAAFKATYSEGFKPPSFFALGLPIALGGNPHLKSETSRGSSVGYEQTLWAGKADASITAFETKYANLVTFDNQTNQLVNANRVRTHGVEVELSVRPSKSIRMRGMFTRLLTRVSDSDEPLRQRPGRRAGVEMDWALDERSGLNWRIEYTADTFDSSVPTGNVMLPTYLRSDLAYTVRWRSWLQFSAEVDNIFDRQNQSYVGAITPGRRTRIALNVAL